MRRRIALPPRTPSEFLWEDSVNEEGGLWTIKQRRGLGGTGWDEKGKKGKGVFGLEMRT